MTEEELDLLASAYVDGEATSEEVALVERDPDLQARVEAMRSLAGQIAAPVPAPAPAMKEQHLATALAELGASAPMAAAESDTGGDVVDLAARSAKRAERSRALPGWLSAAAVFILLGGGVIWAAGRSGDDDFDATAEVVSDAGSDDAADDGGDDAASSAEALTDADAASAGATAESAPAAEVAEEETAEDAMADDEAMDADDSEESEEARDGAATTTTGGFFPDEPVLRFASTPTAQEAIDAIAEPLRDPDEARCGATIEVPVGSEILGYLPVEVDGVLAELFVLMDGAGAETVLIVDAQCQPLG